MGGAGRGCARRGSLRARVPPPPCWGSRCPVALRPGLGERGLGEFSSPRVVSKRTSEIFQRSRHGPRSTGTSIRTYFSCEALAGRLRGAVPCRAGVSLGVPPARGAARVPAKCAPAARHRGRARALKGPPRNRSETAGGGTGAPQEVNFLLSRSTKTS